MAKTRAQSSLYVDSEGTTCTYPHYYRLSETKLKKEQRKLSKMKKGSQNYFKQKRRIAKLHFHVAQQRKDFLHKESRKIANSYDLVAVEDINMRALSQTLHLAKNLMDNGFGMFRNYLKYKLEENGKQYVEVDRWYASSQLCHQCGNKHKLELHERTYHCSVCGYEEQRDI
ncbi:RNA-guided endonuclease InsQ/TnpB family protein, partial [Anaerorhabdus sp.]|uniref:RNA-guided endonuclease InsQ/TnpB family protein n=1 Tax=Anaerorhabdus sp. TaxID=1872524 RepID=UPI002FC84204